MIQTYNTRDVQEISVSFVWLFRYNSTSRFLLQLSMNHTRNSRSYSIVWGRHPEAEISFCGALPAPAPLALAQGP